MRERSLGAAGGLVFVVLSVVGGVALPKPPEGGSSAGTIGRYLAGHQHRIELGSGAAAIGALGLLVLVVYLHERLVQDPFAARLVLVSGSVLAGFGLLGAIVQAMLAQVAHRLTGASLVLAFGMDRAIFYVAPAFGVVLVMVGVARGAVRADLPQWLARLGLGVAAVGLVAGLGQVLSTSTSFAAIGLVGFILTVVWVGAASVALLREEPAAVARVGTPA